MNKKRETAKMIEWYLQILSDWPQSNASSYDFEGQYKNNDLADFLLYIVEDNPSAIPELLQSYKSKLDAEAKHQEGLWTTLISATDTRLISAIDKTDWSIEQSDKDLILHDEATSQNSPRTLTFRLMKDGFKLTNIITSTENVSTDELTVSAILTILNQASA